MSDQRGAQQFGYFDRVNADLTQSLRRCHAIIDDYREIIVAANSNEPFLLAGDEADEDTEDERRG